MYYVYKYIDVNNNLLYVGQTIDLDRRFNEHKGREWDLKKEKILFAKCNSISDMNIYEMYYINKLKPKYNSALVFGDEPSFVLPELIWEEYNKNHFELKQQEVKSKFRDEFNNRFLPENYWNNKIQALKVQLDLEVDENKKIVIMDEIKKCEEKLNNE